MIKTTKADLRTAHEHAQETNANGIKHYKAQLSKMSATGDGSPADQATKNEIARCEDALSKHERAHKAATAALAELDGEAPAKKKSSKKAPASAE